MISRFCLFRRFPRSLPTRRLYASLSSRESQNEPSRQQSKEDMRATASRVVRLAKPESKSLLFSLSSLGITTSISLVFPFALGEILDTTTMNYTPVEVASGLLALFAIQGGLIVSRTAALAIAGERIVARLRKDVFSAMISQELAYFDEQRTGELLNRLSSDAQMVQRAITNNAVQGARALFMVCGGTGMLFYVSPSLALLSLTVTPAVALGTRYTGKFLKEKQKDVQDALAASAAQAEEAISAIATVRNFAAEPYEKQKYANQIQKAYKSAVEAGMMQAWFEGCLHFAANCSIVAVLGYGGNLVLTGDLSAGALTSFMMYSVYVGFNLSSLGNVYTDLMKATGASSRLFLILDRKPQIESFSELPSKLSTPRFLPSTPLGIQLSDVSFSYPNRPSIPILSNLSLSVEPGQHLAIVGGSGCGKSTVVALMTRLYEPDKGLISVGGYDVREYPGGPASLRQNIGVVAQEPVLFSCSIKDNIRYGRPDATQAEIEKAASAASALDFTASLPDGFDTLVGERGVQLSGGQRQRIALARALLMDPSIIILDEATSALDSESEFKVQRAVQKLCKSKTIISIAHRLSTMRSADCVAVMCDGKIIEQGTFQELVDRGGYFKKLIRRQLN